MKRICNFILLLCLVQLAVAQNRIAEIRENLLGNHPDKILVVSHRADWRNAPENSLQGIQNCIDMGVDMVEIDLKRTKDGHLVVMHDKTINRTMSGKGLVEDYTLAELKAMRLKNGVACKTRHQIPTLEEVMLLCKGKIMVNIDKGYDYFQEAYIVLEKTGTVDQCVIKAGLPYEQVKAENGAVLDKVIFMPIVQLHKKGAEAIIDKSYPLLSQRRVYTFHHPSTPNMGRNHRSRSQSRRICHRGQTQRRTMVYRRHDQQPRT